MFASTAMLCLVLTVSDGDTLSVRCEGATRQRQTIRIAAIDAPEQAQPWGRQSRQHLATLCLREWAHITPRAKDRYRRTVADVQCQGQDVARAQVAAGMAWVYGSSGKNTRGHATSASSSKDAEVPMRQLQATARAGRLGLWQQARPVPPWTWRRQQGK